MIKGALFTIGILAVLGAAGLFALNVMGAAMSDNVQASNDAVNGAAGPCGIAAAIGIAMIVGAFFIHA